MYLNEFKSNLFTFLPLFGIISKNSVVIGGILMGEIVRRRITTDELEIGMIVTEDVITPSGILLIPAYTILTNRHIFRMQLYQVLSVVIKVNLNNQNVNDDDSDEQTLEVTRVQPNFKEFQTSYHECSSMIKSQLDSISKGSDIDITELYSLSTSMISSLNTSSDLFNYLHHLKIHDDYTYYHCLNVSLLCNIFGTWLNLDNETLKNLTISGLLHDIGKLSIDLDVLNKPGKLTESEFALIKNHTILGYEMVKESPLPESVKLGILMHHEKYDGSGYPYGLKMDQIHMFGKIIAIVDIYDAMTSDRSYHKRFSPFKVIRMFEQEAYGVLDTYLLLKFLKNIADNYVGCTAKLSNGQMGKIVFISSKSPSRPIVQLDGSMVDMQREHNLEIIEVL
ncbi:MAG: uncharacterized protein K0R15_2169 [Clostridiales bacterium]|jgi:putative nucleotidyltransferase with HDIG domain|nr:uncharacterized protein [Clostridiales bacterium]